MRISYKDKTVENMFIVRQIQPLREAVNEHHITVIFLAVAWIRIMSHPPLADTGKVTIKWFVITAARARVCDQFKTVRHFTVDVGLLVVCDHDPDAGNYVSAM